MWGGRQCIVYLQKEIIYGVQVRRTPQRGAGKRDGEPCSKTMLIDSLVGDHTCVAYLDEQGVFTRGTCMAPGRREVHLDH